MSHPILPAQQERFDLLIDAMLNGNIARTKDLLAKDTPLIFRGVLTVTKYGYHVFSCKWSSGVSASIAERLLEMNDVDFKAIATSLRSDHNYLTLQKAVSLLKYEDIITRLITRLGFVPPQMILPPNLAVTCMRAGIAHPETQAFAAEILGLDNCRKDLMETAEEAVSVSKDLLSRVNTLEEQLSTANKEVLSIKETFEQERITLQRNLTELQDTIGKLSECIQRSKICV